MNMKNTLLAKIHNIVNMISHPDMIAIRRQDAELIQGGEEKNVEGTNHGLS